MQLIKGKCAWLNNKVKDMSSLPLRVLLVLVAKYMLISIYFLKIGWHGFDDKWAKLVYFPIEISHSQMNFDIFSNGFFGCVFGWKPKSILIVVIMDIWCDAYLITQEIRRLLNLSWDVFAHHKVCKVGEEMIQLPFEGILHYGHN